jgi:ABC-type transporter Mla MlaB component
MLRITRSDSPLHATLRLEGKLLRPWLVEVLVEFSRARAGGNSAPRVVLDLSAVTFVDAAGVWLLRDLIGQGAEVAGCSGFVAQLLRPAQAGTD